MIKSFKVIFDIIELFSDFSMLPFRSVPIYHIGFN